MGKGRIERILDAIASQPQDSITARLCAAAVDGLGTPGVSVALAGSGQVLESVCATPTGQNGDALQSDLGEGPSHDAYRFGWPVLVEDLMDDHSWPVFGPAAIGLGLRAMFAFPLRRGSVRLGTLTLSRPSTGALSDVQHADALVFARIALDLVLVLQSEANPELLDERSFDAASTAGIHQATGMASVQLGITVGAALAVLRAHAYATERSLREVADDVIGRRLRLQHEP